MKARFDDLVLKEAFGKIGSEELSELDQLQAVRRELTNPRTGVEILHERILEDKALRALEALSDFFEVVSIHAKD